MIFVRTVLAVALMAAVIFIGFLWSAQRAGLGFSGSEFPWLQFMFTCVFMLGGVFFGTLYRRLAGENDTVAIGAAIRSVFASAAFWRAICVSPLVFMAVYAAAKGIPGDLPSLFLAFQNGFFWENVLKRAEVTR